MKPNYFVDKAKVFPYTYAQTGTFNGVGANDLTMVQVQQNILKISWLRRV